MTFLELGIKVLESTQKSLTVAEIWEIAEKSGLTKEINSIGKTPWSTLGARLYVYIRDETNPIIGSIKIKGKALFYHKDYVKPIIDYTESDVVQKATDIHKMDLKEIELHPYLTYFLHTKLNVKSKTINASKTKKGGLINQHKWKHPDIVGIYFPSWQDEIKFLAQKIVINGVRFYSFEIKKELTISDLREKFFQAVSNSSWANEGYLVAEIIDDSPEFYEEFKRLSNSFGIGLIRLSTTDPSLSEILFPSKSKDDVDIKTMNNISKINLDFKNFLEDVKGKIDNPKYTMTLNKVSAVEELYRI